PFAYFNNRDELVGFDVVMAHELAKALEVRLELHPFVYEDLEEVIEVSASRQIWRTGRSHKSSLADPSLVAGATALGLPASAQVGQCFIEYHEHPQYKKEEKKVMIRDVSHKIEIIPAKYETVEEKVLVKQASEQLKEIAPVYETVTEKVLVKPAYTTWKKGRGLIERIDNTTGEIMCLVEVPAEYKTITKRVLKAPATTEKTEIPAEYKIQKVSKLISPAQEKKVEIPAVYETVTLNVKVSDAKTGWLLEGTTGAGEPTGNTLCLHEIPAKYETVVKKVLKSPATVEKVTIPAEYKTQQVLKLVSPSQEKRIKVPAQMQTVTKKVKVSEPKLEWRSVLCETNMTADLNMQIQQALKNAGFDPGPIDGKLGLQTMQAVDAYQVAKQLPRGGLTMKTLTSLGVRVNQ
ncbi:MAG: peptidoglycan-binding protein, partial [Desulfobulbales bacterium]|nr:peptidoglycan-binding protein [Desulfobulbales bacterium]